LTPSEGGANVAQVGGEALELLSFRAAPRLRAITSGEI
jgi:hypothetical protein